MRRPAALLLALALAAGGCGDEGAAEEAVNRLYDGFAERDPQVVCEALTDARRRELAGRTRSCPAAIGIAMGLVGPRLRSLGDAEVTAVRLDGDRATATVRIGGRSNRVRLAKESGDWKVADFALDQL